MLSELKVSNFAIIDNIHIEFSGGFNVVSGETGAGKSILLKSLSLLMGDKAESDIVRNGSEQATVEGVFDLSARPDVEQLLSSQGVDTSESMLVVRRLISAQGKSKVYLNGSLNSLSALREIVAPLIEVAGEKAPLIEMTGQFDSKNLFSTQYHLELLDVYGGLLPLRRSYEAKLAALNEQRAILKGLEGSVQSRQQRLEYIRFQYEELKALDIKHGEESEMSGLVNKLRHSAQLLESSNEVESILYSNEESVLVLLHRAIQTSQGMLKFDNSLEPQLESLKQSQSLIEDYIYNLREYSKGIQMDPEQLDEMESRLNQIKKLQKKHNCTADELIDLQNSLEIEINRLENADESLAEINALIAKLNLEATELATSLHKKRKTVSSVLADSVNAELVDLNMKGVIFSVAVEKLAELNSNGISLVEFRIRGGKNEVERPIAKSASGGELSRILLSLKRVVGPSDKPRTYLFDEVDTGVSGQTAEKVGKKLKSIAEGQQVICVTHLPQVASYGQSHFLIEKLLNKKSESQMVVRKLSSEDRVQEIARLISGEKITKSSLSHAKELLNAIS
jgi:DNA repair protein RecN (Recombination protein N)